MPALELHPTYGSRRFTLRGVFRDRGVADRKARDLEASSQVVFEFSENAPSGTPLYFVAAQHDVQPAPRAPIPQAHSVDWEATRMAVETFRGMMRAARKRGRTTRWYKSLDIEALHHCVRGYGWSGTRLEVGAGILSSTILVHPFPNANHRTSLALSRMYLDSAGVRWPPYDIRGRGADRLFRETHGFYRDSKYLLQLLRHRDMVRVGHEEGYTHLHIGVNTDAPIRAADLSLDAKAIRKRHRQLAARVIEDLADQAARSALVQTNTLGLGEWVRWYQQGA